MTTQIACPVCTARNAQTLHRRVRNDGVEVRRVKCKSCTWSWTVGLYQAHVITDEELALIGHSVELPVEVPVLDIGLIRVQWAKLLLEPANARLRDAIQHLGYALQRGGLLRDDEGNEELTDETPIVHASLSR